MKERTDLEKAIVEEAQRSFWTIRGYVKSDTKNSGIIDEAIKHTIEWLHEWE